MGYVRPEGFNARARAGSRKKGKQKRSKTAVSSSQQSESLIHVPKTDDAKDADRKQRLKEHLIAEANSKWNSKKKKRLDKYIEKKLKKEERVELLHKLSQTQAPSTVQLQSSATLGSGKTSSYQERLQHTEDRQIRGAIGKRKYDGASDSEDEGLDHHEEPFESVLVSNSRQPTEVGSALRRNADGTTPQPVHKTRMKKAAFASWKLKHQSVQEEVSEDSFDSSDSANDSSSSESETEAEPSIPKKKSLGFKDWALKQINAGKGQDAGPAERTEPEPLHPPPKKQKTTHSTSTPTPKIGPLGEEFQLPSTSFARQMLSKETRSSDTVSVKRPPDVEKARLALPITAEEQPIMEAILLHPVVVICGETGSGKTTQVPQFLYEAGFGSPTGDNPGMIGITQPRRVAAVSMATRVAHELSLTSSKVSYQIRYDATVSADTSIKFMTDGVLLREVATDFLLNKYSVIIIDEAHERSMNTDILIGVLSRVVKLREQMWQDGKEGVKPLRLIIMSATLRVADFVENKTLFSKPPPVITVAARQYPVTIHFNRRTAGDYVTEAIKKTFKIHTRLPPGGILVFLTGQNEIIGVCKKLNAKFCPKALEKRKRQRSEGERDEFDEPQMAIPTQADVEAEDIELGSSMQDDLAVDPDGVDDNEDPEALDSDEDDLLEKQLGVDLTESDVPMHVVPLYSLLPSEKQMLVFKPPPEGSRLVVVATNVAETSLTIPGIRYVVDCGRAKDRNYELSSGIQSFQVGWISKASAAQRAGRAGRTGPGHCYRLYSSALFEHYFDSFTRPEILRVPIEGVVLQMKSMHIDTVINFPFPTPPDRQSLQKAEKTLTNLGALVDSQITDRGRMMSLFPLSPRFSRMLVSGQQHGCLPYVIAIVSALSIGDPFLHDESLNAEGNEDEEAELEHLTSSAVRAKEALRLRRKAFFESQHLHSSLGNFSSDVFKMLSVVGAYEYAPSTHSFSEEHFVRHKAMEETHKLRAQITHLVRANFPTAQLMWDPKVKPPSDLQLKALRQLLTAAFIDQVAVRKDRVDPSSSSGNQYATCKGIPYRALGISEDVYIHPSSVVINQPPPEYIIFTEIVRTSQAWLKGITVINPAWLSSLAKGCLCTFSKPQKNSAGVWMTTPHFGPEGWELSAIPSDTNAD